MKVKNGNNSKISEKLTFMNYPLLYSLLRCPYAIRARMALLMAAEEFMVRSILLKNKPRELLDISPKGTVPVLVLPDGTVIDESLDIMLWALKRNDPTDLLQKENPSALNEMLELIEKLDQEFRPSLNLYKEAKRSNADNVDELRKNAEVFIQKLEYILKEQNYLRGERISLADLAIFPFIRQFSNIEKKWFKISPYPNLSLWLEKQVQSDLFIKTMAKGPIWPDEPEEVLIS